LRLNGKLCSDDRGGFRASISQTSNFKDGCYEPQSANSFVDRNRRFSAYGPFSDGFGPNTSTMGRRRRHNRRYDLRPQKQEEHQHSGTQPPKPRAQVLACLRTGPCGKPQSQYGRQPGVVFAPKDRILPPFFQENT